MCTITQHTLNITERVVITLRPKALWGTEALRESKSVRESEVLRGSKGVGIPSVRGQGISASYVCSE